MVELGRFGILADGTLPWSLSNGSPRLGARLPVRGVCRQRGPKDRGGSARAGVANRQGSSISREHRLLAGREIQKHDRSAGLARIQEQTDLFHRGTAFRNSCAVVLSVADYRMFRLWIGWPSRNVSLAA